jgi:hypothetical protein
LSKKEIIKETIIEKNKKNDKKGIPILKLIINIFKNDFLFSWKKILIYFESRKNIQ